MRILLVEPPISRHDVGTGVVALPEPLALECLAAPLGDAEVRVFDMRLDRGLERELAAFRPHVVASGGCTVEVPHVKRVLREAKAFDARTLTVAGGHHASLVPLDFDEPFVDAVVVGEGEITFRDAVDAFSSGRTFDDVPGLAFRRNGTFHRTPLRPLVDLDTLPFAARQLSARYRRHYFRASWRSLATLYTSRGCPHRCSFCAMWKINRGRFRRRSAAHVVDELCRVKADCIDFVDDNTFADVAWAMQLRDLIRERGIARRYKVYARADTVAEHPELIAAWRDIGLEIALVGFESCRDADLSHFNKGTSIETNEMAMQVLKANDVEVAAYFVIDPAFTAEDFDRLEEYVDRWELLHPVFTTLTPFPGTDFHGQVSDRIVEPDYEKYDFFHAVLPTALPAGEFYARFAGLFRHAYSLRRALRYRGRTKAMNVSWRQIMMRRRFFAQLDGLKRG